MTERLLQFIWQFQYFNKNELTTAEGEPVQVIVPGQHNINQGPDFSNSKILIGNTTWAGTIELHIKTSDWIKHKHQQDKNYNNVILHVVWEDDGSRSGLQNSVPVQERNRVPLTDQPIVPVIELQSRVSKLLLQRYEELMLSTAFTIPPHLPSPTAKQTAPLQDNRTNGPPAPL